MSFHIDYRPDKLEEVQGNKAIVATINSMLENEELPHVIMFDGKSGCGKTTLARIIAKELNCQAQDLVEINSSNNRGIDTARDIMSSMKYLPTMGDCRVYIFDEIHQSTKDFQHSMLKALEDTPEHVYFILCTTEPERLLKTIRNRCHSFTVSPLSSNRMIAYLNTICELEKVEVDNDILKLICEQADGSCRQSLILLEQVINLDDEEQVEFLEKSKTNESEIIDLCRALIAKKKWSIIAKILKGIEQEPEKARYAVLGYCNSVLLNNGSADAAYIIECFSEPFYSSGKAGLTLASYYSINQ